MASIKERERWERWYDQVMARVERQKKAITRLVLVNTEAMAALYEIAGNEPGTGWTVEDAAKRAREAIERIAEAAAAVAGKEEESEGEDADIPDPRRR